MVEGSGDFVQVLGSFLRLIPRRIPIEKHRNHVNLPLVSTFSHLRQLEAESIHIMREVVAECQRPVLLYSIGKDSSVLLRLAQKAFHPGSIQIGRASCRERGEISGVAVSLKKNKKTGFRTGYWITGLVCVFVFFQRMTK